VDELPPRCIPVCVSPGVREPHVTVGADAIAVAMLIVGDAVGAAVGAGDVGEVVGGAPAHVTFSVYKPAAVPNPSTWMM
jgi:hypothetical protein